MSLVITPSRSSLASTRQIVAMRDDLPVPTGPATPSRSARAGAFISTTEEPPLSDGVLFGPRLGLWRTGRRNIVWRPDRGNRGDERLDGCATLEQQRDAVGGIARVEFKERGD